MKEIKRIILRIFFGVEIIIFACLYICGPHSIQALMKLHNENDQLKMEIDQTQQELLELEQKIVQWNTYPLYKEKIAREQLQMACKGEEIYYLK
jgi:cell division protein FtsB